ncbi:MAG: rhomboid family intramembrane serine protease [Balneolaceae bacterium]|nr:rhomboid family intramembrane serine protease [Balneolaceae bacterium]
MGLSTPMVGEFLFRYGALWPIGSGLFQPWQLVSYMFLHGGFGHIFMNLFALWMFGQAIENYWGTKRFTYFYFLTGRGAAILHMFIGGGGAPTVGAFWCRIWYFARIRYDVPRAAHYASYSSNSD